LENQFSMKKIEELVEERLQEKQANKEFKDVGRVANLKKTKAAYRLIDVSNLSEIEQDEIQAFNIVKKDLVWIPYDVSQEKERGVTSGAAFLKVKIREAVPTKPDNSKAKREAYVLFLTKLQGDLLECYNVEQIQALSDKYLKYSITEVISSVIDASFNEKTEEQKKSLEDSVKNKFRNYSFYQGRLIKKVLEEVFSKRLVNILFKEGDTAYDTYREAKEKEPISEEQSAILIDKLKQNKESFISKYNDEVIRYTNMTKDELSNELKKKDFHSVTLKAFKQDIEKFREWGINYYGKTIIRGISEFDASIEKSKPKPNDWSWFEAEKPKSERRTDEGKLTINKKEPLSYIKRTGGYAIGDVTTQQLKTKFGYGSVNYGNYVDDLWSKQHTKFYLQAMSDLGEIFNINIKELNELGNLGIVFGGKGTRGHLAAYYPQTKDINITKANGDGSVAHEYGHYFDNVVVDLDQKKAEPILATEYIDGVQNERLKKAFQDILTFFRKGNPEVTPKLIVQFFAQKQESAPSFAIYKNGSWNNIKVEIKDTIEETIKQYESLYVIDAAKYTTQLRVLGYIIDKFNLQSYDVEMTLKTSLFYQKSRYNYFKYCYDKVNKYNPNRTDKVIGANERTLYWTSNVELFARAWETVAYKKLLDKNRRSDYLVSGIEMLDIRLEGYQNPYPAGKELEYLEKLYDELIKVTKEVYNLSDFVPYDTKREDVLVEFESKKNSKVKVEVDAVKDKKSEVVTFIKDDKKVDEVKAEVTPEIQEWKEALDSLNILLELGGTDSEIAEWKEGKESLEILLK
jgi:hypothetical protein